MCLRSQPFSREVLAFSFSYSDDGYRSYVFDQSFQYPPFDEYGTQIRLLKLKPLWRQPWEFMLGISAIPECELVSVPLHNPQLPPYEALSHCWGQKTEEATLLLNGKRFLVGKSVYDIIIKLIPVVRERYLWIDSVCIDQQSIPELNA
jgi:hypothetical protein